MRIKKFNENVSEKSYTLTQNDVDQLIEKIGSNIEKNLRYKSHVSPIDLKNSIIDTMTNFLNKKVNGNYSKERDDEWLVINKLIEQIIEKDRSGEYERDELILLPKEELEDILNSLS